MPVRFRIRPAEQGDGSFLADMVVEAANWHAGAPRPKHEIVSDPHHGGYVAGWKRPGDEGFVALDAQGEQVGAAWYRMLPRAEPGFGYVGAGVPELIIGVRPLWRAQGVGRALLRSLVRQAGAQGFSRLSLSVQHGNHAAVLYRSEGFVVVESGAGRDTMVKRLR